MHKIKCPVCSEGYETSSRRPKLENHIKAKAKTEVFEEFVIGKPIDKPHADYYKKHCKIIMPPRAKFIFTAKS